MTKLDEAPATGHPQPRRRPRIVWVFGALAVLFLLVGGAGGSYQGKLSDVQKNDNSSFLPASADSTKVSNEAAEVQHACRPSPASSSTSARAG